MKISAIIPLYNGAAYIREAIQSVVEQDRPADEIIVVDDGSTDGAAGADIVREIARANANIKLLVKQNGGQGSARNYGVAHSTGDLIALLDQDDAWYPSHLRRLEKPFLKRHTKPLGWAYSDLDQISADGRMVCHNILRELGPNEHPKRTLNCCLRQDMFILPGASLISRAAFDSVNGFDERLTGYEDDDLFLRMFSAGYGSVFIPDSLAKWRIHSASTSFSLKMSKSRALYFENLVKAFPDEPDMRRFYIRDLVAPRFSQNFLSDYAKAVLRGNAEAQIVARKNIARTMAFLPMKKRLGLHWKLLAAAILFRFLSRYESTPFSKRPSIVASNELRTKAATDSQEKAA